MLESRNLCGHDSWQGDLCDNKTRIALFIATVNQPQLVGTCLIVVFAGQGKI